MTCNEIIETLKRCETAYDMEWYLLCSYGSEFTQEEQEMIRGFIKNKTEELSKGDKS